MLSMICTGANIYVIYIQTSAIQRQVLIYSMGTVGPFEIAGYAFLNQGV